MLELDRVFQENLGDETLLMRGFALLPEEVLDAYIRHLEIPFKTVLHAYDDVVRGGLPFEYCDVVCRFYRRLYERFTDTASRKLLLTRLLEMGVSHNRFFVMNTFVDMVAAIENPAEAAIARDVLDSHPRQCSELRDDLLEAVRMPMLRTAIEEAATRSTSLDDSFDV
jgi:hypothetical protein